MEYLADTEPKFALDFLKTWTRSEFLLIKRLALFGSAHRSIPAEIGSNLLNTEISGYAILLDSSTAEVYRLIESRWEEFSTKQRAGFERRLLDYSKKNADQPRADLKVSRQCFDLIGHMKRINLNLTQESLGLLETISKEHENWKLRPKLYARFHFMNYTQNTQPIFLDTSSQRSIDQFIEEVMLNESKLNKSDEENWRVICTEFPLKVLNALVHKSNSDILPMKFWSIFLSVAPTVQDEKIVIKIMNSIDTFSQDNFESLHFDISLWLKVSILPNNLDDKFWTILTRFQNLTILKVEWFHQKVALLKIVRICILQILL